MTYPFVRSGVDLGLAKGPRLALIVHVAEGGGTVSYLSKQNPNGVSVHYVIEYTGRIVQMLAESHMHTSIRTTDIRRTDGPAPFGRTAAVAVMGDWADTAKTLGPNHASLAVEIEGFAATGPNKAQQDALVKLVNDIRTRHPIGLLGHRDFADYKNCPGALISWAALGGHGPHEGADVQAEITDLTPKLVNTPATWYELDGKTVQSTGHAMLTDRFSPYGVGTKRAIYVTPGGGPRRIVLVAPTAVKDVPGPDCTDEIADAKAAQHEATRSAAIAAVTAL